MCVCVCVGGGVRWPLPCGSGCVRRELPDWGLPGRRIGPQWAASFLLAPAVWSYSTYTANAASPMPTPGNACRMFLVSSGCPLHRSALRQSKAIYQSVCLTSAKRASPGAF